MKKNLVLLSSMMLVILIAASWVQPAQALIEDWMWLDPDFRGFDDFYGTDVIAYTEGSAATLAVTVDNIIPILPDILNVSAVIVGFDWGANYSSNDVNMDSPYQLNSREPRRTFVVTFTVPSITVASNMFLHVYTIYVEYVNATTGPKQRIDTFVDTDDSFAVYSSDQGTAMAIRGAIDLYYTSLYPYSFADVEAEILYNKGYAEFLRGDTAYSNGDFATAKARFQSASAFLDQAFAKESTRWAASEDAQIAYYNALANLTRIQAEAAMKEADARLTEASAAMTEADAALANADATLTNAYGWLAFGIGWILIGVGVIVYGLRKPKPPA